MSIKKSDIYKVFSIDNIPFKDNFNRQKEILSEQSHLIILLFYFFYHPVSNTIIYNQYKTKYNNQHGNALFFQKRKRKLFSGFLYCTLATDSVQLKKHSIVVVQQMNKKIAPQFI